MPQFWTFGPKFYILQGIIRIKNFRSMGMLRSIALSYALFALVAVPLASEASSRLALVFGIDQYDHLPDLANAGNDARALSDKLSTLGFDVMLREGATRREVYRAVSEFETRLTNDGGTGLVFFAGHGIQADGRNYLIPADAQVEIEDDLEAEAIDAGRILESMARAGNPLNILVLDACRDNPLPRRTRSASRGLTVTSIPSGAKGTAIIYAAGEGQVAQDGPPGGNGIFTEALVNALDVPNLRLEDVIKQVTRGVLKKTNSRQRPWSLASIQGDFYFHPKEITLSDTSQGGDPTSNNEAMARDMWEMVKGSHDPELLRNFTRRFAGTPYAASAESKLAMLSVEPDSSNIAPATKHENLLEKNKYKEFGPHKMILVEQNCYGIGTDIGYPGYQSDQKQRMVCLQSYYIDRYEVTFEAYDTFAKETGRELPNDEEMGRGQRPVINVDWDDAHAYARWASDKYGGNFRLPTEAEWEYACRSGGLEQEFCGGDDPQEVAVFDTESTMPVGSKKANALGLYDMSGNAWEMTCSNYDYDWSFTNAGYAGSEKVCVDKSRSRHSLVFRGGQWDSKLYEIRSSRRRINAFPTNANVGLTETIIDTLGFRLVRETN
jgi:formylglycine-generating enzyme required for sulfatase activity